MGAPFSGGEIHGPAIRDVSEKVNWVEKFVQIGKEATEAARTETRQVSIRCRNRVFCGRCSCSQTASLIFSSVPCMLRLCPMPLIHSLFDVCNRALELTRRVSGSLDVEGSGLSGSGSRMNLHVGVLHYTPSSESFPLLADPATYEPNTLDIYGAQ